MTTKIDVSTERREYDHANLRREDLNPDPVAQFEQWLGSAKQHGVLDATAMTLATVVYYSGYHPYTLEKIYTARNKNAKENQRKFFFWYKSEYKNSIIQDLKSKGRTDLISKLYKRE